MNDLATLIGVDPNQLYFFVCAALMYVIEFRVPIWLQRRNRGMRPIFPHGFDISSAAIGLVVILFAFFAGTWLYDALDVGSKASAIPSGFAVPAMVKGFFAGGRDIFAELERNQDEK